MVLVNGGFLHCTDKEILVNSSLKSTKKKKKTGKAISKNQVSDPGPSWPSCFVFGQVLHFVELNLDYRIWTELFTTQSLH